MTLKRSCRVPYCAAWVLPFVACSAADGGIEARVERSANAVAVFIADGDRTVFAPRSKTAALTLVHPSGRTEIAHTEAATADGVLTLRGGSAGGLAITETFRNVTDGLIQRTVTVKADSDQRYYLDFGWRVTADGTFCSFTGPEPASKRYSPGCSGPEFKEHSLQTFPFLGLHHANRCYGIVGDTPGRWENRSFMSFDVENRVLSLTNGDGSPRRTIMIPRNLDATSVYRADFDGWQHIEQGRSQSWTTWIFASPARNQYDIQLAAHLALANGKGFNNSGLEAILRNTSYLLLRRNLLRPESDFLFISGVGYGWKQWVTDGFYMARGLDDPEMEAQAQAAVFFDRISYEDNAQYYLIWSVLVKRNGGDLDPRMVSRAYNFIRKHEVDGLFLPPRLKPDSKAFRTYMDILPYEDGDPPSSNQGFHCGALMAAKELGFDVTDADIDRAVAGYRRMFNRSGGYMATSLKQPQHVGQDALYGEVLTYVVFGKKLLPDEMVRTHLETTMKIQSPFGMRVISKANGDLLDGHSGSYVYGGSWFLIDAANYLDGLIHGMDDEWVCEKLLWRLKMELAHLPAFHESISTVTGKPHGHHLYSWNSSFWWLRRETRRRLGLEGPDPLTAALDNALGVSRRGDHLALNPTARTIGPVGRAEATP